MKLKFNVEGIECQGCEKRIYNAIIDIDGVENVVASHIDGTVTIVVNDSINQEEIKCKIEDIGFSVKD